MVNIKSDFLKEFEERGFLYQATNLESLDNFLQTSDNKSAYIGFDCTANSLHVGSLLQIMILRLLQKHNIKPIILIGGGTTKIGDPSGKDKTRQILSSKDIENNKSGLIKVFENFLDFTDNDLKPIIVDNDLWLEKLEYISFLREVGKFFSVNQMLNYESVKLRLEREQNLSFTEFNYMILQAYDFVILREKYGCRIQLGGSDQWGNIINGIELNRKMREGDAELFGLTSPLLTTSDGKKMGKSESGAIWLDKKLLSAYDYFQFWRNVSDNDVIRFLKLFTDLDLIEIKQYENLQGAELNKVKEILAYHCCKMCHGAAAADLAKKTAQDVFVNKESGAALPQIEISREILIKGLNFTNLLALTNLVKSKGEAKRLIEGGGGRIEGHVIKDPYSMIDQEYLREILGTDKDQIKISAGKKKHALITIV